MLSNQKAAARGDQPSTTCRRSRPPAFGKSDGGGAVAFLPKPFAKAELLAAVRDALARSRERDQERRKDADVVARFRSLKPREREVFEMVVAGLINKTIAHRLGIAEPTVKIHRGRVMETMKAESVADLVRMAERVALHIAPDFAPDQTGGPLFNPP